MDQLRPSGRAPTRLAIVALLAALLLGGCQAGPSGSAPPSPPGPVSPTAPGNRPLRPTPAPSPTFAGYAVRRGDTLDDIARRLSTTRDSLAYWNRATYPSLDPDSPAYDPDRIEVGWVLVYLPGAVVDPENLPGASATPAVASMEPFPTPDPDGAAVLVAHGPRGSDAVALTLEIVGGRTAAAEATVAWLAAAEVPATVFVEGRAVDDEAVSAALARAADTTTIIVGTTGWDGADPAAVDPDEAAAALARADEAIAAATGRSALPWYRPPTGVAEAALLDAVGRDGWTWAVSWDVDPGDDVDPAAGGPTAEDIATRVRAEASGGAIVRLRVGGPRTLEALPLIVDGLREDGWRLVSLSELLGLDAAP
ncbi:MAG: polysaccharide deacetylase family protein [Chloroflexi bacterium]|nr:polysaccharide deacetylase family protein [Chloroflexota bacterium]